MALVTPTLMKETEERYGRCLDLFLARLNAAVPSGPERTDIIASLAGMVSLAREMQDQETRVECMHHVEESRNQVKALLDKLLLTR